MNPRRLATTLCLATLGCGAAQLPSPPMAAFTPSQPEPIEGLADDPPPPEHLLPGDIVRIHGTSSDASVWLRVTVSAGGALQLPLAGDVPVLGLSLEDARLSLQRAMRRFDRYCVVALTLDDRAGHRATVLGAVLRPGVLVIPPGARLSELIALAGGLRNLEFEGGSTAVADVDAMRLMRAGNALPIDAARAIRGDPRHDVYIHAGDLLFVPRVERERVTVLGAVEDPRVLPYQPGLRLTEALGLAHGLDERADDGDVRIIRGPLSAPIVYRVRIDELVAGRGTDVELAPGDVVYVTEHWSATLDDVLDRIVPALTFGLGVAIVAQ